VKHLSIFRHLSAFQLLIESPDVQAAVMSLKPGGSSSGAIENEHPRAEQRLFVVSGIGMAKVGRRTGNWPTSLQSAA
jgi:mannose-6-phosphate isomerase-like protein (cupin superfamily)